MSKMIDSNGTARHAADAPASQSGQFAAHTSQARSSSTLTVTGQDTLRLSDRQVETIMHGPRSIDDDTARKVLRMPSDASPKTVRETLKLLSEANVPGTPKLVVEDTYEVPIEDVEIDTSDWPDADEYSYVVAWGGRGDRAMVAARRRIPLPAALVGEDGETAYGDALAALGADALYDAGYTDATTDDNVIGRGTIDVIVVTEFEPDGFTPSRVRDTIRLLYGNAGVTSWVHDTLEHGFLVSDDELAEARKKDPEALIAAAGWGRQLTDAEASVLAARISPEKIYAALPGPCPAAAILSPRSGRWRAATPCRATS